MLFQKHYNKHYNNHHDLDMNCYVQIFTSPVGSTSVELKLQLFAKIISTYPCIVFRNR